MAKDNERCSFCGAPASKVRKLISSNATDTTVYICNECIDVCYSLIGAGTKPAKHSHEPELEEEQEKVVLPTPYEMKAALDEYVVGQEEAKIALSVAVYNHYKRIYCGVDSDVEIQKSNVLLFGPTGVGKTLLAQTLARQLNVPFAIADATTLTEAGYVGEDVENILLRLIQAADYDIERAEKGIIYVDEIDKIARKSENPSITRDVSGEGVQQALLKILEGTVASVPPGGGRKHPQQECLQINTTNILFICGGAFDGLEKIIEKRTVGKPMGFGADIKTAKERKDNEVLKKVVPQDIIKFGLIPEIVGRLPKMAVLSPLTCDDYVRILSEPKNALLKQYKALLEIDGVELKFTEEAIGLIAEMAAERKMGARGLRSIIEEVMTPIMYKVPSEKAIQKVVVGRACIEGGEPQYVLGETDRPALLGAE